MKPITIACEDTTAIVEAVEKLAAFRAVIEASGTYRWLHELLRPYGTILLAHPFRLRAMIKRRSKTDKLDAQLLVNRRVCRSGQTTIKPISGVPSTVGLMRSLQRFLCDDADSIPDSSLAPFDGTAKCVPKKEPYFKMSGNRYRYVRHTTQSRATKRTSHHAKCDSPKADAAAARRWVTVERLGLLI